VDGLERSFGRSTEPRYGIRSAVTEFAAARPGSPADGSLQSSTSSITVFALSVGAHGAIEERRARPS